MKSVYYFWCSSLLWTWIAVSEHPCTINKQGWAVCSRKGLLHAPASLPRHITTLDLSFNSLTIPRHGLFLKGFLSLRSLNLSSNSIPAVYSAHFRNLNGLHLLDLSNCSISYIHQKSFLGLKNLHTLLLKNNKLKDLDASVFPLAGALVHLDVRNNKLTYTEELAQLFLHRVDHVRLQGNPWLYNRSVTSFQRGLQQKEIKQIYNDSHLENHIENWDKQDIGDRIKFRFRRQAESPTPAFPENETNTLENKFNLEKPGKSWPYFAGFVLLAVVVSVLIAVVAKCKLLHRNRASYHHHRLPDSRSVGSSHAEEAGIDVAYGRNHPLPGETGYHAEDDDGFIEDNYIEPNQDLREEGAEGEGREDEEEEELEPHFKV